jgi:restriction system protein
LAGLSNDPIITGMAKRDDNLLDLLSQCPWWVSVVFSGVVYTALRFILPAVQFENGLLRGFAQAAPTIALPISVVLLFPAGISLFDSARKRKLLNKQTDLNSIRLLSWKEFEELVGEAYRRKGYSVVENHGVGSDGGIDLRLKKAGNLFLVQCKHWKTQKVDVRVVREMYGLMTAERASGVIIITSGLFTQDARIFAENKPIDLVEGYQLADLIRSAQRPSPRAQNLAEPKPSKMTCQKCGSNLVLRVARRGKTPGRKFWGCPNFPKCTFTEEYAA